MIAATTAHTIAVAVSFAIITALHIVLGELAPKTIALERAEATALWVVKPTEIFMKALWPFIRLLNGTGRAVVNMLGLRSRGGHAMVHSEEELKMLVTASQEAGVLEEAEEQMLHRVFAFADLTAGQVMVPRTELVAVDADTPDDVALQQITRSEAHRLLVFRTNLDNVVGILYVTGRAARAGRRQADQSGHAGPRGADRSGNARRRRPADSDAAERRPGSGRHRRVRRHRRGRHVRVVDGADRRRCRRAAAAASGSAPTARPTSTASTLVTDVNEQFDLDIDEEVFTTVGGYVLGRLGRRARVGDTDRRRPPSDARRRRRRAARGEGLALDAELQGAGTDRGDFAVRCCGFGDRAFVFLCSTLSCFDSLFPGGAA